MKKKHLVLMVLFVILTGISGVCHATNIHYAGEITEVVSYSWYDGSPYGKVGDDIDIYVDYDPITMLADVVLWLESWGEMRPSMATLSYFTAPDQWEYFESDTTRWALSGNELTIESSVFPTIYGEVAPVPEPSTIILFSVALSGLVLFRKRKA